MFHCYTCVRLPECSARGNTKKRREEEEEEEEEYSDASKFPVSTNRRLPGGCTAADEDFVA